jgi:hypothetical protein
MYVVCFTTLLENLTEDTLKHRSKIVGTLILGTLQPLKHWFQKLRTCGTLTPGTTHTCELWHQELRTCGTLTPGTTHRCELWFLELCACWIYDSRNFAPVRALIRRNFVPVGTLIPGTFHPWELWFEELATVGNRIPGTFHLCELCSFSYRRNFDFVRTRKMGRSVPSFLYHFSHAARYGIACNKIFSLLLLFFLLPTCYSKFWWEKEDPSWGEKFVPYSSTKKDSWKRKDLDRIGWPKELLPGAFQC